MHEAAFLKTKMTNFVYTARLLWPTIRYPITELLHLYLHRSNITAPLKYLYCYHVAPTQLLCWSTCVGTQRKQWSYFKEAAALLLLCRCQCSNCVIGYRMVVKTKSGLERLIETFREAILANSIKYEHSQIFVNIYKHNLTLFSFYSCLLRWTQAWYWFILTK